MKRMLLTAKSSCFFEINAWSLRPKNLNFLTQKLKPVERWKVAYVTRVNCQYLATILSYLEDSSFRMILKGSECFSMSNLFAFLEKCLVIPPKNFNFFTLKLKPVEQWKIAFFTRVNCQILARIVSNLKDSSFRIILN